MLFITMTRQLIEYMCIIKHGTHEISLEGVSTRQTLSLTTHN